MQQTDLEPSDFSPEKTLVDYFYLFLEKFWLIVIFLILGLILAQYQLSNLPITYQSRATIEVLRKNRSVGGVTNTVENRSADLTSTVAQKLKLDGLFYQVAGSPEFKSLLPEVVFQNAGQLESAKWELARIMNEWTSVRMRPYSPLIDIVVNHSDPVVARDVVAVVLREYKELGETKRTGETTANLNLLNEQISEIRDRLSKSEQSLVIYKQALKIRDDIRSSDNKIRELEKVYLPKWPALVQEKEHRQTLISAFSEELVRITNRSDAEYAFWEGEIKKAGKLDGSAKLKFQLQTAEARNNMLNRDYESDSELYESMVSKLKQGNVEREYDPSEMAVLEEPAVASSPTYVNKAGYFIKFGFVGLAGGMGLAFFLGSMDTRIRRVDDLERLCNTPVFAAIPKSSKFKSGLIEQSQSLEYEGFRSLHTNMILAAPEAKTILVTSSTPTEGKSTICCNLAAASAAWGWGEKVLLIDLDLRKPRIHSYLGLPEDTKGVGDYLLGNTSINECIVRHPDIPDLFIIPAGSRRFEGRLPSIDDLTKMLEVMKKNFDRIIIDSAPILAVSDTLVISKHVDEVCLVFRMWKTPRKALVRTLTQLSQNSTYPLGVVANFMPSRSGFGQHDYYYSYSSKGSQAYADSGLKKGK